jgi:endoglucanase
MKKNLDKKVLMVILGIFSFLVATAQNKPFPQNTNYGGRGFKPTSIATSTISTNYTNWKNTYLKTCTNNGKRVEFNNPSGTTVSEGQGYGMVIAAYMGDKATFDALYTYEKSRRNTYGNMGWRSNCSGFYNQPGNSGSVSATDGDMDIAHALCVATVQWGTGYLNDAKSRINKLKTNNYYYNATEKKWIGEWRDGTTESYGLSSYWCPGIYRVFKDFTGDTNWDQISNNTYNLLYSARHATTGFTGVHVNVNGTTKNDILDYNDSRSPWRWAIDYLWSGNTDSKAICDRMTDWANSKGITNVKDGYKKDGTSTSNWTQSPAWTGAWACGAMLKNQASVNSFTTHFNTCTFDEYYASSLRLLYQLTLTGNYWRPYPPASARLGVDETSLIDQFVTEGSVSIYPNPSVDKFTVGIPGNGNTSVIQLIDAKGKVVLSKTTTLATNNNTAEFNFGKQKEGMYTLKTSRGGKVSTARVMVGK